MQVTDHDTWFRFKILQALADNRPDIEDVEVESLFAAQRITARLKPGEIRPGGPRSLPE